MNPANFEPAQWRRHLRLRESVRARHVRLRILSDGVVELVVPKGFDERSIPAILDRNEGWVLRQLQKPGVYFWPVAVEAPTRISMPAVGEHWSLHYLADDGRHGCRPGRHGELRVSGGHHWQGALKRWLARKGREHLVPWLESVSSEVGLPFQAAAVRGQRTRWGSCSASGKINLNYGLLFLPPELVRYLFIHELCHTRHMNHSRQYWSLVASVEPEYRSLDHALRRATSLVPAWVHARQVKPAQTLGP